MSDEKGSGWIIIGRPKGHNSYITGVVERSFSMDVANGRANLWWFGHAVSNFGTQHELKKDDVLKTCEESRDAFARRYPDQEFAIFDVDDPSCPVEIDWADWRDAGQHAETLSGVKDKYRRRNPRFSMR